MPKIHKAPRSGICGAGGLRPAKGEAHERRGRAKGGRKAGEGLSMALQRLRSSKMTELDMLILKAQKEQPSSEAAVPVEETGTSPSGELEELLPDETSEVFTGA